MRFRETKSYFFPKHIFIELLCNDFSHLFGLALSSLLNKILENSAQKSIRSKIILSQLF